MANVRVLSVVFTTDNGNEAMQRHEMKNHNSYFAAAGSTPTLTVHCAPTKNISGSTVMYMLEHVKRWSLTDIVVPDDLEDIERERFISEVLLKG